MVEILINFNVKPDQILTLNLNQWLWVARYNQKKCGRQQ